MKFDISAGDMLDAFAGAKNLTICTQVSFRDEYHVVPGLQHCTVIVDEPAIRIRNTP